MKTKGEASDAIHKALARLQLLCGKKAERFHADNADEQNSCSITHFLETQGTVRSFTAPTSSPSNAIVKRRFESIFAAARTTLKAAPPRLMLKRTSPSRPSTQSIKPIISRSSGTECCSSPRTLPCSCTAAERISEKGPTISSPSASPVVNTKKHKKKIEDRAIPANYLRCLPKDTYQVYRRDKNIITPVRQKEFVLRLGSISDKTLPVDNKSNTKHNPGVGITKNKPQAVASKSFLPLETLRKYAFPSGGGFPDQSGGGIDS